MSHIGRKQGNTSWAFFLESSLENLVRALFQDCCGDTENYCDSIAEMMIVRYVYSMSL